jgi:hypothetical protein
MNAKTPHNCTFVYSHTTFLETLDRWQKEQIKAFPHRETDIKVCVMGIQHFMRSSQVKDAKMIVSGDIDTFEIKMPEELIPDL